MILRLALASPLYQLFDYLPPLDVEAKDLQAGARLIVPFGAGNHKKIAFLIEAVEQSEFKTARLKRAEQLIDTPSLLSLEDLQLLQWVSRYYHHPLGEVMSMAFPTTLRHGKAATLKTEKTYSLSELGKLTSSDTLKRAAKQQALFEQFQHAPQLSESQLAAFDAQWRVTLKALLAKQLIQISQANKSSTLLNAPALQSNEAQQAAIDKVIASLGQFAVFLLEGVTGSGKTEVYLQIMHEVLQRGQQILVLVPEINLTPQLESRFKQRFAVNIAVSHSKLSQQQRHTAWLQAQQGECAVLLGTRSALFTPFQNLGLIILDEEHDASFKQHEGLRFSARDTAIMRGKLLNIPVLLGSATPSLVTLHNVSKQRYQWLHLPERAGSSIAPSLQLLDIRNQKLQEGLSERLINEIHQTLNKNEQVILFLNRRGFAPRLICHGCGWVAACQHCTSNLVLHQDKNLLRCHHCDTIYSIPPLCPDCQSDKLTPLGLGTERVEQTLKKLFSDKTTLRLDYDSTQKKGALENYLEQIDQGKADIILGTQLLAKGHHFPNVTLVAILDVDSGLFSLDFHATEKLAQLIIQVSGRSGRADKLGKVILQTRHPHHGLLITLIKQGYQCFAEQALKERQNASLPPFSYQALMSVEAKDEQHAEQFINTLNDLAAQYASSHVLRLGPVPAPLAKRAGFYRYQLLLQSTQRPDLH
ncbi:partial Primosomal protein N', partial [Patescibacteria group bacterium]